MTVWIHSDDNAPHSTTSQAVSEEHSDHLLVVGYRQLQSVLVGSCFFVTPEGSTPLNPSCDGGELFIPDLIPLWLNSICKTDGEAADRL